MAQPYEIGVSLLVEPTAAYDELLPEIPDVGDWPAERGEPQLEEDEEDFKRRTIGWFLAVSVEFATIVIGVIAYA